MLDGPFLEVVGLDDAVAGKGFVHHRGQFGVAVLDDDSRFADLAAENDDGNEADGKSQHRNQRKFGIHIEKHGTHHDYHRGGVFDDDGERAGDGVLQGHGIGVDARHQITGVGFGKKTDRKVLEMGEQPDAEIGDGADGGPLEAIDIQICEHAAQNKHERHQ